MEYLNKEIKTLKENLNKLNNVNNKNYLSEINKNISIENSIIESLLSINLVFESLQPFLLLLK